MQPAVGGEPQKPTTARLAIAAAAAAAEDAFGVHHGYVISLPPELTVNNNAQYLQRNQQQQALLMHRRQSGCLPASVACRQRATRVVTTFADYAKLQQKTTRSESNAVHHNSADAMDGKTLRQSIFNRPQLSTFAEYQKWNTTNAEHRSHQNPASATKSGNEARSSVAFQLDPSTEESDAAAVAAETAVIADNEGEEDLDSGETRRPGCCACCSRGRRGLPDKTSRRKRRLVGQDGAAAGVPNRVISISLEDDAELADVKDMDPTITLMPYVLFESERAKVLYQAVSADEAELLKRAINLYANDLYKKVLMRLHMHRYLRLIKDAVVRSVLSKRIVLGQDSALAASVLGIDITEESKSSGASSSTALSVGLTFDSQPVEMLNPKRVTQLVDIPDISRQLFKPAPKFSDLEILELLNSGKIIDVTGRASLESLVSLPTTKVGQRRSE